MGISEKVLGVDHPDVADTLINLADLYSENSDERAEPLYLRALEIRQTTLGSDHPAVAAIRDALSERATLKAPPSAGQ